MNAKLEKMADVARAHENAAWILGDAIIVADTSGEVATVRTWAELKDWLGY